jgi:hypothetical protein
MNAADLLLDLGRLGIRFEADGERLRYFPRSALPPDRLNLLKKHKAELLATLRPTPDLAHSAPTCEAPAQSSKAVCRCGSTTWRDVPIHDGQSIRRDCGRCGRFLDFSVWHGRNTGHNDQ